jgi:hypothetical protein
MGVVISCFNGGVNRKGAKQTFSVGQGVVGGDRKG